MNFTVRMSGSASVGLLFAFGLLFGLAMSPTLVYYAGVKPQALWQAGAAIALFIAGCGAAGYATFGSHEKGGRVSSGSVVFPGGLDP